MKKRSVQSGPLAARKEPVEDPRQQVANTFQLTHNHAQRLLTLIGCVSMGLCMSSKQQQCDAPMSFRRATTSERITFFNANGTSMSLWMNALLERGVWMDTAFSPVDECSSQKGIVCNWTLWKPNWTLWKPSWMLWKPSTHVSVVCREEVVQRRTRKTLNPVRARVVCREEAVKRCLQGRSCESPQHARNTNPARARVQFEK